LVGGGVVVVGGVVADDIVVVEEVRGRAEVGLVAVSLGESERDGVFDLDQVEQLARLALVLLQAVVEAAETPR
jgi:hypothetical protein